METLWKKIKRSLSLVLCICMVMSMLPGMPITISAAGVTKPVPYDGVPVTPSQITPENYWQFGLTESVAAQYGGFYGIRNAKELYGFANLVNSGRRGIFAVLLQDIVINETVSASGAAYSWTPIGCDEAHSFYGAFFGNGHTISGRYVDGSHKAAALFGYVDRAGLTPGSVIKDVVLANSYIHGAS